MNPNITKKLNLETRPPHNQDLNLHCISLSEVFTINDFYSLSQGLTRLFSEFNKKRGKDSYERVINNIFSEKITQVTQEVGWLISDEYKNILPIGPQMKLPNFVKHINIQLNSDIPSLIQLSVHFYIKEEFNYQINEILNKEYPEKGSDIDNWGESNPSREIFTDELKRRDIQDQLFRLKSDLEQFMKNNFFGIFGKFKLRNNIKTPYLPSIDFFSLEKISKKERSNLNKYTSDYQRFFRTIGFSSFAGDFYEFENYLALSGDYDTEHNQIKILVFREHFKDSPMYENIDGSIVDAFKFYNKLNLLSYYRLAIQLNDEVNLKKKFISNLGGNPKHFNELESTYSSLSNQTYFSKRFIEELNIFYKSERWYYNFPEFKSIIKSDKTLFEKMLSRTLEILKNVTEKEKILMDYVLNKRNFIHIQINKEYNSKIWEATLAVIFLAIIQLIIGFPDFLKFIRGLF